MLPSGKRLDFGDLENLFNAFYWELGDVAIGGGMLLLALEVAIAKELNIAILSSFNGCFDFFYWIGDLFLNFWWVFLGIELLYVVLNHLALNLVVL